MYHFVISDKNNAARRESVTAEFKKINVTPCFFDAVMGSALSQDTLSKIAAPNTFLGLGEIGCAANHLNVYKKFLSSAQNSVFIFEDDICMPDSKECSLFVEIKSYIDTLERPSVIVLQKSKWHKSKVQELSAGISIYSARNLFCTYGYILNRKAADNILSVQTPIRFEIDAFKFYYWLDVCDLYCLNTDFVKPLPAVSSQSTIEATRSDDTDRSIRKQAKDRAYRELYNQLSLKQKLKSQYRRFCKAIHKPFETTEY